LAEYLGLTADEFTERHALTQQFNRISAELQQEGLDEERQAELERMLPDRTQVITPSIIVDSQYPGILDHGFVYGKGPFGLERRSRSGCPGFGELCHLDYRGITRYSVEKQLTQAGIPLENIDWHEELAIDPADSTNDAQSNRREQLAGFMTPHRTFNGAVLAFSY
jgi:hypothetical protein